MTRATREPPDLAEVRRDARKFVKSAVRVLRSVMNDDRATPAVRANAAMQLLQIAFGKQLQLPATGGSAVDDLLGSLGTDKPPVGTPGTTESNNGSAQPIAGAATGQQQTGE